MERSHFISQTRGKSTNTLSSVSAPRRFNTGSPDKRMPNGLRSSNGRAMRVKFQADADLDGRVLRGLRRVAPEIDIRTAADAALAGLEDPEGLLIAADSGESLSAKIGRLCLYILLASRLPREAPVSSCCAKQFLSDRDRRTPSHLECE